ncbi:MAG TPA: formate dehydrogenase accessory protein FdhE [Blastocatellia bacterium]|nr:formate dehydrogenase accessory protein FdhE [Blastocatellia bacterium]
MAAQDWDDRIKRAGILAKQLDFAREPLSFYSKLAGFQKELYTYVSRELGAIPTESHQDCPFHGGSLSAHLPVLIDIFPSFVTLTKEIGTEALSFIADELSTVSSRSEWGALLEAFWSRVLVNNLLDDNPAVVFFPKAFLQPYAEFIADRHKAADSPPAWELTEGNERLCPLCGSRPQLAVLKPEGEGSLRMLCCSMCMTEWRFRRVCCAACGEESVFNLSYHKADEFPHVRIDVCENCHGYIKTIDLSVQGHAVPVVDEIAAMPLDLWASEKGYKKIELNLVGV